MASKSRNMKTRGSGKGGSSVSSATLIASIIAAFLVGYVVSAFVGGFRMDHGFSGGGGTAAAGVPSDQGGGSLFQPSPSRSEYIEVLEDRVAENPDDQDLWTELGNAYYDSDQYRSAIEAYQRSLELDSGNANVWTDLGVMYRRIGEYSKAVASFERAVVEDPTHQMSRFNRGIVLYYDLDDRIGAFESWDELAKMNPNFRIPDGRTIVQMLRDLR